MALSITANFDYKGKLPNFARDQFATLAAMKAYAEANLDEGHVAYCVETGRRYSYKSGNTVDQYTGKWRLLSDLTLAGTTGTSTSVGMTQLAITTELAKRAVMSDIAFFTIPDGGMVVNVLGQSTINVPSQKLLTDSLDGGYYRS